MTIINKRSLEAAKVSSATSTATVAVRSDRSTADSARDPSPTEIERLRAQVAACSACPDLPLGHVLSSRLGPARAFGRAPLWRRFWGAAETLAWPRRGDLLGPCKSHPLADGLLLSWSRTMRCSASAHRMCAPLAESGTRRSFRCAPYRGYRTPFKTPQLAFALTANFRFPPILLKNDVLLAQKVAS